MKRFPLAALVAAFFMFLLFFVSVRQAVLLLVGVGLGAALAGARFGFTTGWRQLVEQRDPRGVTGQVLLLALASVAALPLLGQFSELHAALGPPSVSLLVGAFVFGLTMQIADGCGSGTLYKAGLGVPLNAAILPLFALGSFLGSVHLDSWLALGQMEPVSFSAQFGTQGALLLTLALLAACLVAVRATVNLLLAGQPWGVVYGFGLWAAKVSVALGLFDPAANAFWSQAGNAQRLTQTVLMDVTTITNIGILGGALWVSARTSSSDVKPLTRQQWVIGLVAGFVMGYSSRLAFGCNVGAMLSGISTGSLHGWIWVPLAFAGTLVGVRVRRRYGF